MIAIASGLLANLETVTSTAVKKDAGSGGFAAAFEEVSAKDAGTVAQAGVGIQGRRGGGGRGNRGVQAGILSGRSSRSAVSTAKAAIAKAVGDGAAEGNAADVSGGVDGGVVGKTASSTGTDAGRPAFAAKLNAGNLVEAEAAGQEVPTGSELRASGPSVGDEGVSSSAAKRSESADSTVRGTLPGGTAKVPLQSSVASAAFVVKVGGVATSASEIAGQGDAGTAQTQSADVAAAAEGASAKVVVDVVPDGVPTGGSTAGNIGLQGAEAHFKNGVVVSGTKVTEETVSATPVAVAVSGQTARVARDSGSVAGTKAQGVSGGVQTSTAKTGLQQERGTVQVQPTDLPATPAMLVAAQDISGVIGQESANLTPVVGAKQTFAQQVTVASDGTDRATVQGQVPASRNTPVVARSTVGPQEILQQQVIGPSVVASPVIGQRAAKQPSVVQTAVAQPVATVPQGAVGLVAQDASSVAHVLGGPVTGSGQVTAQQTTPEAVGSEQAGARQIQSRQGGTQQVQAPFVGSRQVETEQAINVETGSAGQKPDLSVSGAAEALQRAGKPIVAGADAGVNGDKDKHTPGVAATASASGKKVAASASDRSSDANAGAVLAAANASVPAAANASVPAAPVPVPSLSASPVATVQSTPVVSIAERTNHAPAGADGAKANIVALPVRGASASPMMAGTVADPAGVPGAAPGFDPALENTGVAGQAVISEGSGITGVVGQAQNATESVAAAVITEVAGLQAGRVAAGGTAAGGAAQAKERRLPTAEGKTAERTSAETTPITQPITLQHPAGSGPDAAKPLGGSHPSSSEAGTQSLATGTAGLGGVVPLSATQVATHGAVAPSITATATAGGTAQSSTLTGGTGGPASTGGAGMDSLVSPMAHTTLQATPTVLEVGVPGGTHGWLKIRAEIGEGGTVQASMSAATHEGQETLRRELPAMNAFLDSEHVPVNVQVAAHGVSGAGASIVAGGDAGFNLGSGLSQDAGSAQREAQAGLLAGGDGARQGSGEGSQENARTTGAAASGRAAVSAESDWVSNSNSDSGSGYGSGISANGGSWLNVMA